MKRLPPKKPATIRENNAKALAEGVKTLVEETLAPLNIRASVNTALAPVGAKWYCRIKASARYEGRTIWENKDLNVCRDFDKAVNWTNSDWVASTGMLALDVIKQALRGARGKRRNKEWKLW